MLTNEQLAIVDAIVRLPNGNRVVLLDVSSRNDIGVQEYNANVFCVRDNNEIVWQVSSPIRPHGRDSFVAIELTTAGIRADRFFGQEFLVDTSTGVATEIGWHK